MNVFLRARLGMRRPERPLPALLACLAVAALTACTAGNEADAPAEPDSTVNGDAGTSRDAMHAAPDSADTRSADSMQVEVWFDRGEEVVAVMRRVPASGDTLTAALQALLAGPTEAERQQGLTSWFSAETADALRSARVEDGLAIVDLRDVSSIIPNASTSLGSTMMLQALNGTVFSAADADSAEYRFDGSCDAFGEFVQRGCIRYAGQP